MPWQTVALSIRNEMSTEGSSFTHCPVMGLRKTTAPLVETVAKSAGWHSLSRRVHCSRPEPAWGDVVRDDLETFKGVGGLPGKVAFGVRTQGLARYARPRT